MCDEIHTSLTSDSSYIRTGYRLFSDDKTYGATKFLLTVGGGGRTFYCAISWIAGLVPSMNVQQSTTTSERDKLKMIGITC